MKDDRDRPVRITVVDAMAKRPCSLLLIKQMRSVASDDEAVKKPAKAYLKRCKIRR